MSLMQRMTRMIQRGHAEASATINTAASRRQRGASAIEYVIIIAVIAFAIFAATNAETFQTAFSEFFAGIENIVQGAADKAPEAGGGG